MPAAVVAVVTCCGGDSACGGGLDAWGCPAVYCLLLLVLSSIIWYSLAGWFPLLQSCWFSLLPVALCIALLLFATGSSCSGSTADFPF
jgi:hypothetical protein